MERFLTKLLFVFTFGLICFQSVQAELNKKQIDKTWNEKEPNTDVLLKERKKLFDEGNFRMFIHCGLYSQLAGRCEGKTYYGIGEWIMHPDMADIPIDDYIQIAEGFNPSKFNAEEIAQLAKDVGMKYIIITSKHQDGFAMFDSDVDAFNIVDGKIWKVLQQFEFGNLINDPSPRRSTFDNAVTTQYIMIQSDVIAGDSNSAAIAEIEFLRE